MAALLLAAIGLACALLLAVRCAMLEGTRTSVEVRNNRVPLSEDEERILSEIEERLSETDPDLVREVSETTVFTQPLRSMKWALVGFGGGVLVMVVTLSTSFLLAFVGFLVMLGASLALERNARQVGRTGLRVVAGSRRTAGIRESVGGTGARVRERMRDRFRRGDHGRA